MRKHGCLCCILRMPLLRACPAGHALAALVHTAVTVWQTSLSDVILLERKPTTCVKPGLSHHIPRRYTMPYSYHPCYRNMKFSSDIIFPITNTL